MTSRSPYSRARGARRLVVAATLLLAAAPALARTLHWSSLEVEARLDAEGTLHVVERQAMVFDGAWNGGERIFRLGSGQKLTLHALRRLDPRTGAAVELVEGDLGRVDGYRFTDRTTLRWRSRLPSDPPFADTEIVYELDYSLAGVLRRRGDRWRLDHDFAFPDRFGTIERYRLRLELAPEWRPMGELDRVLELEALPPGRSVVVTADLEYLGEEEPSAPIFASVPLVQIAFSLAFLALTWLFVRFRRAERALGRDLPAVFGRPSDRPPDGTVDRATLEEHLLRLRPEVVGALWDRAIGAPEVSAVVARLVAEGRLASRVVEIEGRWRTRRILELELLEGHDAFDGYEGELIRKLFFDGRTQVDTDEIRDHYKSTGFSPAGVIRPGVTRRMKRVAEPDEPPPRPPKTPSLALFGLIALSLALEWLMMGRDSALVAAAVLATGTPAPLLTGSLFAYIHSRAVSSLGGISVGFLLPLAVAWGGGFLVCLLGAMRPDFINGFAPGPFGVLALALLPVWLGNIFFNVARGRDGAETLAVRKRLAAIRRHLKRELARPQPELEDGWLPYLLAFGLQREVDRWFQSFGDGTDYVRVPSTGGSSGGAGGWTGGGGAFGGAGATAAWTAAASGLAAGVASPSSSGSGGGGGGGGSSGGGGGGGW